MSDDDEELEFVMVNETEFMIDKENMLVFTIPMDEDEEPEEVGTWDNATRQIIFTATSSGGRVSVEAELPNGTDASAEPSRGGQCPNVGDNVSAISSTPALGTLLHELRLMRDEERTGSDTNNRLAGLASAALEERPGIVEALEEHGFMQREHVNQFRSELTVDDMGSLIDALSSTGGGSPSRKGALADARNVKVAVDVNVTSTAASNLAESALADARNAKVAVDVDVTSTAAADLAETGGLATAAEVSEEDTLSIFCSATDATESSARSFLISTGWNLDAAIDRFYEDDEELPELAVAAAASARVPVASARDMVAEEAAAAAAWQAKLDEAANSIVAIFTEKDSLGINFGDEGITVRNFPVSTCIYCT
eukprot:SAG11_NODE_1444_length_4893_cov_7.649979_3_plen_369_part_00